MTISEISRDIRAGGVSPVELTKEAFDQIQTLDGTVNAFITVEREKALADAELAEQEIRDGFYRGPLHGIPYAAKDLFYTNGVKTTIGSKVLGEFVPDYDAAVIEKLNESGAIRVGKTNLHEWALGITNDNPHYGPVRNPWDTERIPGGSSGGSAAALASEMCWFSLGSDTGGSIRIPASLCSVIGLKPTFGRVSRYGCFPLGHTLDHVGPFTRSVEDAALVYEAIAGNDYRDDSSVDRPMHLPALTQEPSLQGIRIGVPTNFYFDNVEPVVSRAVQRALGVFEGLGAEIVDLAVPDIAQANAIARLILHVEAASVHHRRLQAHREDFGADTRSLFEQGSLIPATHYLDAQRARRVFNEQFMALFKKVDVLVTPAMPTTAAKIGEESVTINGIQEDTRMASTRFARALNLTGMPLLTQPCGFTAEGLPIGLQIVAGLFDEARLLEIGHAYETATQWTKRKPPLLGGE